MALRSTWLLCTLALYVVLAVSDVIGDFQQRCLSFAPESVVQDSVRTVLEYVPANTVLEFPGNDAGCGRPRQLVSGDLCRVALSIPTSNQSMITFELWLPRSWSGRFLGTGNGGIDGCIKYEDLAYTSANGFASVGSNNGHNGTSGVAFYRNPDVIVDFSWRALHTSVLVGKELVGNFYGRPHDRSYYLGCSLGGRQGIKAAEKFPADFDGIVAGAPAIDFNNLASWRASFFPITGGIDSPNFISAATWTSLIHKEILNQCDGIDNVLDGIIEDPNLCDFHPETLLCKDTNSAVECLTSVQVEIVQKIFSPFRSDDDHLVYPAMQPGSEIMAISKLYAGKPFSYSEDWFKYAVYSNPLWNASTFTSLDAVAADNLNPADIRTWPTSHDLAHFRRDGGKILSYHGGQDNQITSFQSERFYWRLREHLHGYVDRSSAESSKFEARGIYHSDDASFEALDGFFRLFRIPGMFHCNSGPGAWVMGQGGGAPARGIPFAPEQNILAALVTWVEEGVAPETIGGVKFVEDVIESGVALERRHCRWERNALVELDLFLKFTTAASPLYSKLGLTLGLRSPPIGEAEDVPHPRNAQPWKSI